MAAASKTQQNLLVSNTPKSQRIGLRTSQCMSTASLVAVNNKTKASLELFLFLWE
jgi:hypothetical protein